MCFVRDYGLHKVEMLWNCDDTRSSSENSDDDIFDASLQSFIIKIAHGPMVCARSSRFSRSPKDFNNTNNFYTRPVLPSKWQDSYYLTKNFPVYLSDSGCPAILPKYIFELT